MTNFAQRTKITLKDIGAPSLVATKGVDGKYVLGTLIGIATGFVERQSPDGSEKFEGLAGSFRVVPAEGSDTEPLESGVLFIPNAFHNMVAESLKAAQQSDPKASLNFAFEVASISAKNPAGYSWEMTPLIENAAENPLDKLVSSIPALAGAGTRAQLTDQSAASGKKGRK
jgi:hypothetical protein